MRIVKRIEKEANNKYIIELNDAAIVEAAMFRHQESIHFCIPSQVGCGMGCKHCSTTYSSIPFIRNIFFDEFKEMIDLIKRQLDNNMTKLTLSFSGHGEALLNWDNVKKAIDYYYDVFSNIYITTIGVSCTLNELLSLKTNLPDLYFSIHASSDFKRKIIIPMADNDQIANLQQILDFGKKYSRNGRRIILNYMICNINSSYDDVTNLVSLCRNVDYPLELRLTRYIDIGQKNGIESVDDAVVDNFIYQLSRGINNNNISVRLSRLEGEDMGIACGQMRASMQAVINEVENENNN